MKPNGIIHAELLRAAKKLRGDQELTPPERRYLAHLLERISTGEDVRDIFFEKIGHRPKTTRDTDTEWPLAVLDALISHYCNLRGKKIQKKTFTPDLADALQVAYPNKRPGGIVADIRRARQHKWDDKTAGEYVADLNEDETLQEFNVVVRSFLPARHDLWRLMLSLEAEGDLEAQSKLTAAFCSQILLES